MTAPANHFSATVARPAGALAGNSGAIPRARPEVASELLDATRRARELDRLLTREGDVLALLAEGRSDAAIAKSLVIGEGAVHVANIFLKLGLEASEDDNRRVLAGLRYLGTKPI
jgi:DNA-binding NarL/FixJ family response regulator